MSIGYLILFVILLAGMFVLGFALPELARPDLLFGVRMTASPEDRHELVQRYRVAFTVIGSIVIATTVYLLLIAPTVAISFGVTAFVALIVSLYLWSRKAALQIKETRPAANETATTAADLRAHNLTLSWPKVIAAVAVVIGNLILAFVYFDSLPSLIARHYDSAGNADGWAAKSWGIVLMLPLLQVLLCTVMLFSARVVRLSKIALRASSLERSAEQVREYRRTLIAMLLNINLLIQLALSAVNLQFLGLLRLSGAELSLVIAVPMAIVLIYAIVVALRVGQSGHLIATQTAEVARPIVNRDDDRFWKAGIFYFNPDDPAVWVEKRVGVGIDVNWARPQVYVASGLFCLGILALIAAAKYAVDKPVPIDEVKFQTMAEPVAENLLDGLLDADFPRAAKHFSPKMLREFGVSSFSRWYNDEFNPAIGDCREYSFKELENRGGFITLIYQLRCAKDDVVARVVFEPSLSAPVVDGLWFESPSLR